MNRKIIASIIAAFVLTGCSDPISTRYLSTPELDSEIRNKYTNCIVTKLAVVGIDSDSYYPKWLVKTPDNNIIFIQRHSEGLIEQRIF